MGIVAMKQIEHFNKKSRTENSLKSSAASSICNIANILAGLAYRTIFVYALGAAYLGINGVFTSILSALSLAELGITTAIVYRFYKPISENDSYTVGKIMCFFKWVYRAIALVVLVAGLAIVPFLPFFIKDSAEIPSDVNIYCIYALFLLQSVSTYMFSYRLTILNADQRGYTFSVIQLLITLVKYLVQSAILLSCHDFTIALALGVAINLLMNWLLSIWVTRQYPAVFAVKTMLEKGERRQIYKDVYGTACHQFGFVALTATDNIVLSSFLGIVATGLYSNYYLITSSLNTLVGKLLGSFVGSLGSAHVTLDRKENYSIYTRLVFVNFAISGLLTACLFLAINDFISLWLGPDLLLDEAAVIAQCVYFYLSLNRVVNGAFINAFGLFSKDRIRPLVEALINIAVSVALVQVFGVAGVFWGTAISFLVTIFWREPYLLHKLSFSQSMKGYWIRYAQFVLLTLAVCGASAVARGVFAFEVTWISLFAEVAFWGGVYIFLTVLLFGRTNEFAFIKKMFMGKLPNIRKGK